MTQLQSINGRGWRFDDDKENAAGSNKSPEPNCSDERLLNYLHSLPVETLEEIDLSGNSFGLQACRLLADRLGKCERLSVCRLNDMFTGRLRSEIPLSLEFIVRALEGKPIRLLDLSDNAFGPDGLRPLVPLISRLSTLKVLRLHNTGLGPQGGQLLADALKCLAAGCGGQSGPLEELVVGRSRLENGSMALLSAALRLHPNLRVLVLPQNGIRPEGIITLTTALAECKQLRQLDLQDNTMTEKGAIALASALPHWQHLESLNIGDCLLTARGFRHLLPALEGHLTPTADGQKQVLRRLNLQYNELNTESMQSLINMLRRRRQQQRRGGENECDDDDDDDDAEEKEATATKQSLTLLEINGNGGADLVDELREVVGDEVLGSVSDMEEEEDEEDDDDDEASDEDSGEDDKVAAITANMANVHVV